MISYNTNKSNTFSLSQADVNWNILSDQPTLEITRDANSGYNVIDSNIVQYFNKKNNNYYNVQEALDDLYKKLDIIEQELYQKKEESAVSDEINDMLSLPRLRRSDLCNVF